MSRKLDALVAEKVFGARWLLDSRGRRFLAFMPETKGRSAIGYEPITPVSDGFRCPRYSTSIADSWKIVQTFIYSTVEYAGQGIWTVSMSNDAARKPAFAKNAPLAICLAALRAVGVDEEAITAAQD